MAANIVQWKKGTSTLATVTAAFDTTPTNGNVVLLIFAADDYNGSPNAGWNQRTGMEQQTYHGGYVWDRVASGGGNSFQYTIGSATNSSWILLEISGLDANYYGTSNGQSAASSASSYTTPAITPASGADWLLIAAIGSSNNGGDMSADLTTWLNSFTHIASSGPVSASGTRDSIGVAYRVVTGNGSTSYSSGASFPFTKQSHSGMIIALKVASGGNNYSLTASGGAYAVSGTAATLKTSRKLLMASAAYAVTGTAATPRRGFKIAANAASYALTGQAATFKRTYKAAANGGSYATTGTAATLKTARKVVGGGGAYAVTGSAATLSRTRNLLASSASYLVTGSDATLTKAGGGPPSYWRILCTHNGALMSLSEVSMSETSGGADLTSTANTIYSTQFNSTSNAAANVFDDNTSTVWYSDVLTVGATSYVGQNFGAPTSISEMKVRSNTADNGSTPTKIDIQYSYDGSTWETINTYNFTTGMWLSNPEATLAVSPIGSTYALTAASGAYVVTGAAATLKRALKLAMAAASYGVTGTAATLRRGFKTTANGGSYAVSGTAATLKKVAKLSADSGSYGVTGQPATLKKGRTVAAASGTYALSGQPVTLTKQLLMSANGGAYALVGSDATLTFKTPNIRMTIGSGTYEVSGDPVTLSIKRLGGGGGGKVKRTKPKPYRKIPSVRDVVEDIYRQPEPIEQDAAPRQPEIPALDDATRMRSAMTAQEIEALARETQASAQRARSQLLHQSLAAGLPSAQPEWTDEEIAIALLLIA